MTISKKVTGGYGFSVRGSKPVRISSVRENDDVSHTHATTKDTYLDIIRNFNIDLFHCREALWLVIG